MKANSTLVTGGIIIALLVAGYFLFSSATSTSADPRADGVFSISTSFYPLAFALEEITGELATVTNVGEGRDPHDFRPSTQDILTFQRSDLVVLQGAEFEPWGDDVTTQLTEAEIPVVIATEGLDLMEGEHDHAHDEEHAHEDEHEHGEDHTHEDEHMHEGEHEEHHGDEEAHDHNHDGEHQHGEEHAHEDEHGHDHGAFDPHTWLDPVLFSATVEMLIAEVSAVDPENAETYEANGAMLLDRLSELNAVYETGLASCSLNEVITSHDAFGYLGERYEFEIHTIGGLSTQDTPSAVTLAELREEAEEGVNAILLEENSISAYGETLARETGLQTLPINPIAYVIPAGADYFSIAEQNLATLRSALSCNG